MYPLYELPRMLSSDFTSDFRFYDTIPIHILLYHFYSTSPVFCSYLIIPWVVSAWYHLLYIYLLMHACAHDMAFNACLWFSFIDARVITLHAIWHSRHHSPESSDSPRFSCLGFGAWSVWIHPSCWLEMRSGSVDHRQPVQILILSGPLLGSRVFLWWC